MTRRRSEPRSRGGFTIIEAIATIVVLTIMGSIVSFMLIDAVDGYVEASTSAQLHAEMSIAMDRAVRELRSIDLDPLQAGTQPNIDDVTPTSVIWRDDDDDIYSISLSGLNLELAVNGGAANILLTNVTSFAVQTYDEDNAALATTLTGPGCDTIRRIELDMMLTRSNVSESLKTKMLIRSTMSGGG